MMLTHNQVVVKAPTRYSPFSGAEQGARPHRHPFSRRRPKQVKCSVESKKSPPTHLSTSCEEPQANRRSALLSAAGALTGVAVGSFPLVAEAKFNPGQEEFKKLRRKIPLEEYSDGPEGLKYFDLIAGDGPEAAGKARVAVHYDVKWKSITIATSRQGAGVTGGVPYGFNIGAFGGPGGAFIRGIELGVQGMQVGGLRRLIVPANLAYGNRQVQEIPPGADLQVDLQLLSIKKENGFY